MNRIKTLDVFYNGDRDGKRLVGTLALYQNRFAAFEYSKAWLENGFSISPFSLPLEQRVFIPEREPFGGLFGVFNDSLPDGWGRLLVDRVLQKNHIVFSQYKIQQKSIKNPTFHQPEIQHNIILKKT